MLHAVQFLLLNINYTEQFTINRTVNTVHIEHNILFEQNSSLEQNNPLEENRTEQIFNS